MRTSIRFASACLAAATLAAGCASAPSKQSRTAAVKPQEAAKQRQQRLQATWKGKAYDELVAAYGKPKMILAVPQQPDRFSVIYEIGDGGSRCLDTFIVSQASMQSAPTQRPTVIDYNCR